ncbi:oxygenase MpaB family protein [Novosphingobium sp. M1R2S20]|uniref:Oxygenase MpaB family protein n=1 Tax=Novosphingobium rhizovicinum TaxID=3228928 RepID=A0ABV3RDS6_9SPHN
MMLDRLLRPVSDLLAPPPGLEVDFATPPGAPALVAPDSLSWRIFANGLTLFVGGVCAVILELAEPSVRAGVWDHSSFRRDPMQRLRRTGMAAMITVYAPREEAAAMIARVNAMHAKVRGSLPGGGQYRADDPRLLDWVQATASFGFIEAYSQYAHALSPHDKSRAFAEAQPAARLYGAQGAPRSLAEWNGLLEATLPTLEPSETLNEFLNIMRTAPIFPRPMQPVQRLLVRAAVSILPGPVRRQLQLQEMELPTAGRPVVQALAAAASHMLPSTAPQLQARKRMHGAPVCPVRMNSRSVEAHNPSCGNHGSA